MSGNPEAPQLSSLDLYEEQAALDSMRDGISSPEDQTALAELQEEVAIARAKLPAKVGRMTLVNGEPVTEGEAAQLRTGGRDTTGGSYTNGRRA